MCKKWNKRGVDDVMYPNIAPVSTHDGDSAVNASQAKSLSGQPSMSLWEATVVDV